METRIKVLIRVDWRLLEKTDIFGILIYRNVVEGQPGRQRMGMASTRSPLNKSPHSIKTFTAKIINVSNDKSLSSFKYQNEKIVLSEL